VAAHDRANTLANQAVSIPSQIIQTARSSELPPVARASATNLRLLHPRWEHLFFDDEAVNAFIRSQFPQHRTVFESFPYKIQRFDFFRYLAVYRLGGFYFDLDIFLWQPLHELLHKSCVFPFEELTMNNHLRHRLGMDWEIGNYGFGAAAGSPFLEAVIENCVRGQKDAAWLNQMMAGIPGIFRADFEVLNSTGPGMLTRTLAENPSLASEVTVLFPEDVREPRTWHHFGSYGVHLMEGSWRTKGGYVRRRLACLWEDWARKRNMDVSRQLGPRRGVHSLGAHAVNLHSSSTPAAQPLTVS